MTEDHIDGASPSTERAEVVPKAFCMYCRRGWGWRQIGIFEKDPLAEEDIPFPYRFWKATASEAVHRMMNMDSVVDRFNKAVRVEICYMCAGQGLHGQQDYFFANKNFTPSREWLDLMKASRFPGSDCLLYTSPSPRDGLLSRMPSSA